MNLRALLLVTLVVLSPIDAATAHMPIEGARGFYGGALHPLFVPAHVLAIMGAGLLIGQQVPRWQWPTLASYVAGLTAGFTAMVFAFAPELAVDVLLAAAATSGAFVALARPLPEILGCALAFTTGITLALDLPPDVISVRQANVILIGTFSGATVLLLVVVGLTAMLSTEWQRIGVRILGSWIAASAILVLALRLAP